jgi:alpha-beta hydrolase superfamily lysophospholipase
MAFGRRLGPLAIAVASLVAVVAIGAWVGPAQASTPLDLRFALFVAPASIGQTASLAWRSRSRTPGALLAAPLLHAVFFRSPFFATLDTLLLLLGFAAVVLWTGVIVARCKELSRATRFGCLVATACTLPLYAVLAWVLVAMQVGPAFVRLLHLSPRAGADELGVSLTTSDGLRLGATLTRGRPGGPGFLLVHGHNDGRARMAGWAEALASRGAYVLRLDLRGHGTSDGVVVSFGDRERRDLEAGLRRLASEPGVDGSRLGILAASMGGGTALNDAPALASLGARVVLGFAPASNYQLIVDSPLPRATRRPMRVLFDAIARATGAQSPFDFDEASAVTAAGVGVLIFHGRSDTTVPAGATAALVERTPSARVVWIDTGEHSDLPNVVLASPPLRRTALEFLGLND